MTDHMVIQLYETQCIISSIYQLFILFLLLLLLLLLLIILHEKMVNSEMWGNK